MNTISIDSSLYNSTAQYAQQHHMNINQVVEAGLKLLLSQIRPKHEKVKSVGILRNIRTLWPILIHFQISLENLFLQMKMDVTQELKNTPYKNFY